MENPYQFSANSRVVSTNYPDVFKVVTELSGPSYGVDTVASQVSALIVNLQDKVIRTELIRRGWTPPKEDV